MPTPEKILQKYWGHSSFRKNQEEIINYILDGKDTLALLPTGGGKSICYQIPSIIMDGICIVISPLISLMNDQVENITQKGIKAISIPSDISYDKLDIVLTNCIFGGYKFIYLSPERLQNELVQKKISEMNVNLIAVDEAHCISEWGHDFRPSYRNISVIRNTFPSIPILALTATATAKVSIDIQDNLNFKHHNAVKSSFNRENISYLVMNESDKRRKLIDILNKINKCSIVYVRSRKDCEEICRLLVKNNIKTDYYHAGIDIEEKKRIQISWQQNKTHVIVATNAFGMGIDKSDVRLVIHMHIPLTMESYLQETGRVGRDQKKSYAILLYNDSDIKYLQDFIEINFPSTEEIKECYQQLANYFQLAINDGMEERFNFNIVKFSRKYNINKLKIHAILKYLEKENYLSLNNIFNRSSMIRFTITNTELSQFRTANKYYESFIKLLLRSYTGLFDNFIKINEMTLAARLKTTKKKIIDTFLKLEQLEILNYSTMKNNTEIIYNQNRIDSKYLVISEKKLSETKNLYLNKIDVMIHYCKQKIDCRSKILLSYFGERYQDECGKCDICQKK